MQSSENRGIGRENSKSLSTEKKVPHDKSSDKKKYKLVIILILILLLFGYIGSFLLINNEIVKKNDDGPKQEETPDNNTQTEPSQFDNNGAGAGANISFAFFYSPGCDCTEDAIVVLNYIKNKYPGVQQHWYNLSEDLGVDNFTNMIKFFNAYNIPSRDRKDTPFLFIGDFYYHNLGIQNDSISAAIEHYLGVEVPLWPQWKLTWTMHIAYFYNSEVNDVIQINETVEYLNDSWNSEEDHLIIHNYPIDVATNLLLFKEYFSVFNLSLNTKYESVDEIYAGIFIGDDYLLNDEISNLTLNNTIFKYSGRNTPLQDITPGLSGGKICVIFFFTQSCGTCNQARTILGNMKAKYPELNVIEYDTGAYHSNEILKQSYFEHYNVPQRNQGTMAVFIKDKYFVSINSLNEYFEDEIKRNIDGCNCPEVEADPEIVKNKFTSFTILTVMAAGLIDGINPCAFATLIFFIMYLTSTGRSKRQVLIIGLSFTLGIFVTYMALGLGLYTLLASSSTEIKTISIWLYPFMGILALILGFYSLYDFNKARKKKKEEMKLQLPKSVKSLIGRVIKHQVQLKYFALIAIITGIMISLLEFLCTGQVYLPTIMVVVATVPEYQAQAILLLFLYNLMFILPLIVIFVAVYTGVSSEQLQETLDKNRPLFKLLTAIVFFSLGLFLIFYSFGFFRL